MDIREKLVELLEPHMSGLACEYESGSCELTSCRTCNARNVADHLIANGVTVQECIGFDGKWIVKGQEVFCSNCNKESGYNAWGASAFSDYCPNCGKKMMPHRRKENSNENSL